MYLSKHILDMVYILKFVVCKNYGADRIFRLFGSQIPGKMLFRRRGRGVGGGEKSLKISGNFEAAAVALGPL